MANTVDFLYIDNPDYLTATLARYINEYYESRGGHSKIDFDWIKVAAVVRACLFDNYPIPGGNRDNASPFKQSARLWVEFIAQSPIGTPLEPIDSHDWAIENHQNIIVPFHFCRRLLEGASIQHSDGAKSLPNIIRYSRHTFADIVTAMKGATQPTHFKLAALLLEQMAYRFNPDTSYSLIGDKDY